MAKQPHAPALWQADNGPIRLYLFGTFHAVPRGAKWLTPQIEQTLDNSQALILEVTGLEEERASGATFRALAFSPGQPPLAERIPDAERNIVAKLVRNDRALGAHIDHMESWAVAIMISAAGLQNNAVTTTGAPEEMLSARQRSRNAPIMGLETIQRQLGAFDEMPEPLQRTFLIQSIREAVTADDQYAAFYSAWAKGDMAQVERLFDASVGEDAALRIQLVTNRNRSWVARINRLGPGNGKPYFVAVGAGHLIGPESLIALLQQKGWRVNRLPAPAQ